METPISRQRLFQGDDDDCEFGSLVGWARISGEISIPGRCDIAVPVLETGGGSSDC